MDIVVRATVMFAILYGLLRLLGKRELAEMTPFELVLLVVLGDLIQQGVTHNDFSLTGAALAIGTFAFWALALNWLTFRSRRLEKLLDGEPTILVRDGALLERAMARNRLTRSELESEMRLAGIAHVADVAWGVLETNGKISFIARNDEDRSRSF
ncbi:DUF421 domain-containing protein [Tsuneonella troitsensis]|uniref:DUF421 domain-containing protein n=1 Tax=Tsuneonella troitsensis TaxID=292222 RepID=UPI00070E9887|nr:YetF domain-containing protein [Tsuneonella troitsensis]